jgi:hypothetical protein
MSLNKTPCPILHLVKTLTTNSTWKKTSVSAVCRYRSYFLMGRKSLMIFMSRSLLPSFACSTHTKIPRQSKKKSKTRLGVKSKFKNASVAFKTNSKPKI